MENHHRETEFDRRISQQSPMDGFSPMDCGTGSPMSDDPFSLTALLSLDNYPELCSPCSYSSASPFSYSAFQQISSSWASLASPNAHSADMDALDGISPPQRTAILANSPRANGSGNFASASADADADDESMSIVVPKSMPGVSLVERMLRALSLFKESSGGGILAQVWMPVKHGNGYVLSTSEQPFLLDQILAGYREVSRAFTFSAEETPGLPPGLPGRVFISGLPEWTSNVVYYEKSEYLRAEYAHSHEVRGSLALPIFDPKERSCCAVLELVTTKEKSDFDLEMDSVCIALQAVDLRTIKGQAHQQIILQSLSQNQRSAFNEILDVLRACCHAHMLPLALTWVPFSYDGERVPDSTREVVPELNSSLRNKSLLCIEDSACYVNDTRMKGFLHACAEHCLEKGQGIGGKALLSNHPFFSPDIKGYNIQEYPLAHHARKYGLNAAVAIRLRSTFTGNDDYILEFFLPVNCRGSSEQQELLNNLSTTMQRIGRSLRTVSDAEVVAADSANADVQKQAVTSSSSPEISIKHSQQLDSDNDVSTDLRFEDSNTRSGERDEYHEQFKSDSTRQPEKKRSTAEKNISLSVLQQYFSGSLKDAAKSIGVCPTTLKRICRQQGISRWPSRKINKVNRSLKKIQTVINSVQGVEGALKYDPATGCLVAGVSAEKSTTMTLEKASRDVIPSSSTPDIEPERPVTKLELDDRHTMETSCFPNVHKCEADRACLHQTEWSKQCTFTSDAGLSQRDTDGASVWPFGSKATSQKRHIAREKTCRGLSLETFDCQITSKSSESMATDDVNPKLGIPSSSSMTDSSSGSASSCPTFKKGSNDKVSAADTDGGATTITVKATYKEDTVRFKFLPSAGCQQLFEEIAKRYRLAVGTFQLKYMDDEQEWVMLSSDDDLIECVEVLESIGSGNLKLLVRDMPCCFGSSGGSNYLQA